MKMSGRILLRRNQMSKIPSSKNPLIDEDEEYLLDEVKGRVGAKKKLSVLNKGKLTKSEMDRVFLPEDFKDDEAFRE